MKKLNEIKDEVYKIIPVSHRQLIFYNNNPKSIFKNNIENINLLNNKSLFGEFMMKNFNDSHPICYYYNDSDITYINKDIDTINNINMILKPNCDSGGYGIKIINKIDITLKNVIISKYVEHTKYHVGHFIIKNGKILKKIYFSTSNDEKLFIKCGNIENYTICYNLECNEDIFENIFTKINYSGFSCCDFVIDNNKIIIFEINPRPGGSLIKNIEVFDDFLETLKTNF